MLYFMCILYTVKRKLSAGRPVAGPEKKQRYQVMLEPSVAENTRREVGGNNLSRGLSKLSQVNARLRSVKDKYETALKVIAETTTDQKSRKTALDALEHGYRILSELFQAI